MTFFRRRRLAIGEFEFVMAAMVEIVERVLSQP